MKLREKITSLLLCLSVMCSLAACGKGESSEGSVPGESSGTSAEADLSGEINLFVPFDNNALTGLEQVKNRYQKLHPDVKVKINSSQSSSYARSVEGCILAPEETNMDIVQINVVSQYYGTDKIVDFSAYLNQRNPYGEKTADGKYPIWKDMLEEEAYFTEDSKYTVPSLSFESNYVVACYNKQLFAEYGWAEPTDWKSLLDLLEAAKNEGYTNPLALNYDKSGVESIMFGYVLYMYLDQYFRDMTSAAHSADGDFSYIDEIDGDWVYDAADGQIDLRSGYTYNISRLIDAYFNGTEFNAKSPRFADMMANFKDLMQYSSDGYNSGTARNSFHNGVLTVLSDNKFKKSESSVIYVCRKDYLSDFQAAIGSVLKFDDELIPVSELSDYLGWFALPAMTDNDSVPGGAPAADNVRTFGGPNHHPMGIINHNDQKRTALVMDFMKFWYSPEGMDYYYGNYGERGIVCPLKCLVKDFVLPENILLNDPVRFDGICTLNPYFEIGVGYDSAVQSSDGGTVRDKFVAALREYLGGATTNWGGYGAIIDSAIRSGFKDWANRKNLKVSSPEEIKSYLKNSPFKAV